MRMNLFSDELLAQVERAKAPNESVIDFVKRAVESACREKRPEPPEKKPRKKKRMTSKSDVAGFFADYKAGVPVPAIADKYKVSSSTVKRRLGLLGWPEGITDVLALQMLEDQENGLLHKEIAQKHGIARSNTVSQAIALATGKLKR